ncbi:AmmeMemoRadiSam system protein A, partial [Patescibacteria group bacterium]|nr:AmmeMemoRadiSam system protein A [Patescibacteria group bacterium]
KKLIEYLKKKDAKSIIEIKHDLIYEAGECGLKSIVILLGILDGINCKPKLLSYEGPFGVGYLVMQFEM